MEAKNVFMWVNAELKMKIFFFLQFLKQIFKTYQTNDIHKKQIPASIWPFFIFSEVKRFG